MADDGGNQFPGESNAAFAERLREMATRLPNNQEGREAAERVRQRADRVERR